MRRTPTILTAVETAGRKETMKNLFCIDRARIEKLTARANGNPVILSRIARAVARIRERDARARGTWPEQSKREKRDARIARMIDRAKNNPVIHARLSKCAIVTAHIETGTAPARATRRIEKPARQIVEHRAPAVGPMKFDGDPLYAAACHAVSIKANAATRRGMTRDKNVYLKLFDEMVQIASLAMMETGNEIMAAQLNPDPWGLIDEMNPLRDAMRACGAYDRKLSTRAQKDAPIEHISETMKVSYMERRTADKDAARDLKERVLTEIVKAIDALVNEDAIKPARRDAVLMHLKAHKLSPADHDLLIRVALRAGLIARDTRGNLYIPD